MNSLYQLQHEKTETESVWWIERIRTWDRCFVRKGEVRLAWQQMLPDDFEPEIDFVSIPVEHFLAGEGNERIAAIFGTDVLDEILAETRRRNPGVVPRPPASSLIRHRPANEEVCRSHKSTDAPVWALIGSFLVVSLFAGWLIYWPATRIVRWYDSHYRQALEKIDARVTRSGVDPFVAYVRNSTMRGFHGIVHVSFDWHGTHVEAPVRARQYVGSDADRAEKHLRQEFPEGSVLSLFVLGDDPRHPEIDSSSLRPGVGYLLRDILLVLFGSILAILMVLRFIPPMFGDWVRSGVGGNSKPGLSHGTANAKL